MVCQEVFYAFVYINPRLLLHTYIQDDYIIKVSKRYERGTTNQNEIKFERNVVED